MSRYALLAAAGCLGWTVCTLCAPGQARADDTRDLQGLLSESYVRGASKTTESNATAPAISTTLTSDDIRRFGIHSLQEAIDFLSLGVFTSSTLGRTDVGSDGVIIPNDQGDHVLLLVNGHAVNDALHGAARLDRGAAIPMEAIDHIEVILGPGSVLYGSSAMLGVINVVTKEARDFAGTHVVAESELFTSWRAAAGGGYQFPVLGQPGALVLELEYYGQNGPTFAVGPQDYGANGYVNKPYGFGRTPATGVWGGSLTHDNYGQGPSGLLTFRVGELELDLHASTLKQGLPFNSDIVAPEAAFDDRNNYRMDRSAFADLKHRWVLSSQAEIRSRLYADTFESRRYVDVPDVGESCLFSSACRVSQYGASRWVGLEEQASFDWLRNGDLVTLLGVDGRARWLLAQEDTLDEATGAPLTSSEGVLRANDRVFAAYGQQTWQPTPWLGMNGGARFDYDERFGDHVSPRLAASVVPWEGGTFKAIYADAFRAPSWEESSVALPGELPASGLRPETVQSVTGALDQRLGVHRLLVGVFRSWWTDMVELHQLTAQELSQAQQQHATSIGTETAYQYRNVSSIDVVGYSGGYEGSYLEGSLRLALNVTGAYARRSEPGGAQDPLPLAPQVFGNARVSYALPGKLPTLALAGRLLGRRLVDQYQGFPGAPYAPALPELRATVAGQLPWVRALSYRVSADWALVRRGAYVVGPFQASSSGPVVSAPRPYPSAPELDPIDPFRATAGLQLDF